MRLPTLMRPVCALIVALSFFPVAMAAAQEESPHASKPPFGQTKVWSIELELTAKEYEALQPPPPAGFGFGPPGVPPGAPPVAAPTSENKRDSERSLFGTEFRWAEAKVALEGETLNRVGVRYAGDITYLFSSFGLKRPMKIAFDKFEKQTFRGLHALELHAMPLDPSKAREALGYAIFRTCGVPAPRTAYAEVRLTVPGLHDKELLGLYTVVEEVDANFLSAQFGGAAKREGLALKPFGLRGVDFLGESWEAYKPAYRPHRDATEEEQKRLIAFAKLINTASDTEFEKQIGDFLDVEAFLRYMAANALTSNLEGFLALGHNYTLYLDPASKKFHFIPGDLEFAFANLLLMGTPAQLMELSLVKPYPGENKLPDRLLSIKANAERYQSLLKELSTSAFTKEQLLKDIAAIEAATKGSIEKENETLAARPAPAGAFGPPPGGAPMGPQPPDLKTFAEKRAKSIADQLAGKSKGSIPRPFSFGGPPGGGPGGGNAEPIDEAKFIEEVHAPEDFEATLYAAPPKVSYPVAIACEPTGAIYVAVDEQGSLGRTPGGGRILRCVDKDDDGKVDAVTIFCKVEHPRGVTYRDGKVWVMHPPTLSVFEDADGDGVADKEDILVTGLTTNQVTDRGGDHTTNCVRMGIDGWLYIGVGDYGIKEAVAKDGSKIVQRGGGIVRVRPDGTELEVYCQGLRNPFDLAIDPFLNIFTRDNTNDGAGWDTRVSLLKQSALYGYTQLFANFTDEIMPTLGTFGNSGGTGALFIQDPRWPKEYQNTLFTGDWGRSEVYRHTLAANGPTFDLKQEVFVQIPRATGMDIDADGRLYVASWRSGEASVYVGPNIGFIARVSPKGITAEPFPDLKKTPITELLALLASPQSVVRHHVQGEILARGKSEEMTKLLISVISDSSFELETRVAAIFTLKQLDGADSHFALLKLAEIPALREFALRALTDRKSELKGLTAKPFIDALSDPSPRVRAQALISLGRLGNPSAAPAILPLTMREAGSEMPKQKPLQNQPDPGRVIPHLAVRALVALHAVDACIAALDGPHAEGALWALRYMHDPKAADGLIKKLGGAREPQLRQGILTALIRLYYREADYDGSWWGIRPDNTGPYYDKKQWEMTKRIEQVLTVAIKDSDPDSAKLLKKELARHQVSLPGIATAADLAGAEAEIKIVLPKADPKNLDQLGNLPFESASSRALAAAGDAKKGEELFKVQSCVACHTTADGQTPKGPHLFEIGKRYKPAELVESILKPSAKLAQGYEAYHFTLVDGRTFIGFVVSERADSTTIREADGTRREFKKADVEEKVQQKQSAMPEGIVANLTPEELADLLAYLQSLK